MDELEGIEFVDINALRMDGKEDEEELSVSMNIAEWIMKEFEPGFVIIGSPHMALSPSGFVYPRELGVVMNDHVQITRSVLANILIELAGQLNQDIDKLENFINKTIPSHFENKDEDDSPR